MGSNTCHVCGGVGRVERTPHTHRKTCLTCHGTGRRDIRHSFRMEMDRPSVLSYPGKTPEVVARREEFAAEYPDVIEHLDSAKGALSRSLREDLITRGYLSDAQIDLVRLRIDDHADLVECPEGEMEIRGVVASVRAYSNPFGRGRRLKTYMVVRDDRNFIVTGLRPVEIFQVEKDALVEFTATIEKGDEYGMGFFSNPTNPKIV